MTLKSRRERDKQTKTWPGECESCVQTYLLAGSERWDRRALAGLVGPLPVGGRKSGSLDNVCIALIVLNRVAWICIHGIGVWINMMFLIRICAIVFPANQSLHFLDAYWHTQLTSSQTLLLRCLQIPSSHIPVATLTWSSPQPFATVRNGAWEQPNYRALFHRDPISRSTKISPFSDCSCCLGAHETDLRIDRWSDGKREA